MIDKLESVEEKFENINAKLCDPDVVSDIEKYRTLTQEMKHLTPVVEKFREYKKVNADFEEAQSLLDESGLDKDFREMAQEQFEESRDKLEKIKEELKVLLLPRDPNDDKNVIIEIRGGAGGEESALFANSLFRMYSMYAEAKGWKTEVLSSNPTELGGFKEISFMISGDGAYSRFKFESGVHRVQRVPETESQGRIHTSTVTVAVLPEAEEVDLQINPTDLQIDTFRSSGAGGQHINKTSSAIRITHIPTGTVVQCQNERSQHQNKDKAMQMLKAKLFLLKQAENAAKTADIRGEVMENGWGSQIRSYVLQPYTMVKDNRTGEESGNAAAVLDGDLDRFMGAYLKWLSLGRKNTQE